MTTNTLQTLASYISRPSRSCANSSLHHPYVRVWLSCIGAAAAGTSHVSVLRLVIISGATVANDAVYGSILYVMSSSFGKLASRGCTAGRIDRSGAGLEHGQIDLSRQFSEVSLAIHLFSAHSEALLASGSTRVSACDYINITTCSVASGEHCNPLCKNKLALRSAKTDLRHMAS